MNDKKCGRKPPEEIAVSNIAIQFDTVPISYTGVMLTTRIATTGDIALITKHRHAMFAEIGWSTTDALATMSDHFRPWVERMMATGKYVGWVVEEEGKPVASAGFFELDWPPHPFDPAGEARGYLLNFWVETSHRRRCIAKELVKQALAESRRRGFRVTTLHASEAGRPVYESLGFRRGGEMMLIETEPSSTDS